MLTLIKQQNLFEKLHRQIKNIKKLLYYQFNKFN